MKKYSCIFFVIFFLLLSCATTKKATNVYKSPKVESIQRIAVAPFTDAPGILAKGSGITVADVMVTQLLGLGKYRVIERSQIEKVLKEQGLWQSGAVDASTAKEVGRIVGVDAVVIGSVTEYQMRKGHVPLYVTNVPTRSYSAGVAVRIVDVESGEIMFSTTAVGKGDSYGQAADQACRLAMEPIN